MSFFILIINWRYYFVNHASTMRQGGAKMMDKDLKSRFSLRIDSVLMDKFGYVAEYEGRTKNGQLIYLIRQCVAEFEKEHGTIDPKDLL
jgi:hypothetical protein